MNLSIFSIVTGFIILSNFIYVDSIYRNFDSLNEHEIINVKIEFDRGSRQEEIVSNDQLVSVEFRAFGRNFRLSLQEDESILSPETKIFIHGNRKITKMYPGNIPQSSIYRGTVDGEKHSSVSGYFSGKMFYGNIQTVEQDYHLEPASLHYKQETYKDKEIIYNISNMRPHCQFIHGKHVCQEAKDKFSIKNNGVKFHPYEGNVSSDSMQLIKQEKICSLEVIADHTYFESSKKNHGYITAQIISIVKSVEEIFRNADIDGDGTGDGIGFIIEKITIFENANEPGYPLGHETDNPNQFLEYLTEYNHPYCFLICFTHRPFCTESNCVIEKTTETTAEIGDLGGICPVHHKSASDNIKRNHNVGFVSNKGIHDTLSKGRIIMNILHMMGHAFGCVDDPTDDPICSPGDFDSDAGNFIMHHTIPYANAPNSLRYSPCSLISMRRFLKVKGMCLKTPSTSTCGNGIVEEGEECDCGSTQEICNMVNHCCSPKGSSSECSVRKKDFCNPDRAPCCDSTCSVTGAKMRQMCYVYAACRTAISYCDGTSPFCPEIIADDGTPCMGTSKTCKNGECISDICHDKNLKSCQCLSIQEQCQICCLSSNGCQTAAKLNLTLSNHQLYLKYPGTYCNSKRGICSSDGNCTEIKVSRTWNYNILYFYLSLPYIIYTVFAIAFFKY